MNKNYRITKSLFLLFCTLAVAVTGCIKKETVLELIKHHYHTIINQGTDFYGVKETPVWISSLDPLTKKYPVNDTRPAHIPARVYLNRSVDAPKGASLYWNFPDIAAAFELSRLSDNISYREAAREYVKFIFSNCKAANGVVLWGNHYYYDAFQDQCVRFKSEETPIAVDFANETGDLHEMRPISPPWEILWQIDSAITRNHILNAVNNHIVNQNTGEFNRHADGERGYAFLEYGGILTYSLTWLYQKTNDESLLQKTNALIEFSYGFRNLKTGLMENSPTRDRWDKYTSTTEVGLWGNYILKAAAIAPENYKKLWIKKVDDIISIWLKYGFDQDNEQFYGGLNVADGTPFHPDPDYPYRPGYHAEIWSPLFPTHNYPMQMAESCLLLYRLTGKDLYKKACGQWLLHVQNQTSNKHENQLLYAENYGRIIHFLLSYQQLFKDKKAQTLLKQLVSESISNLYLEKFQMFRSHTGEMRYDAVDGIGLLSLSLMWYQSGDEPETCDYFF